MCKTTNTKVSATAAATAAATSTVATAATTKTIISSKGPLGPTWQPIYDTTYSILMLTFNLPHLSAITALAIIYHAYIGTLHITPAMPLVAVFLMARVPFVGFGMSMCLHRYFAHGAFKTSRGVQFLLALIGSMSLQGGILWWSSKHNR